MPDALKVDLSSLADVPRALFSIPLRPLQGQRFQPTGFPSLGAATYQTSQGTSLLVESTQSMANRLEMVCWDTPKNEVIECLKGISFVRVERTVDPKGPLTTSIHEPHRINSGYIIQCTSDPSFRRALMGAVKAETTGPVDRGAFIEFLLKHDVGSLLHGLFISDPKIKNGRLRLPRALSAFIEADDVSMAASGGVKTDQINPKGDPKPDFGMVPFARDEYTAARITLYVNLDLAQIRGYGLKSDAERLLVLLAFYKLRCLLEGSLRLRTACDLCVVGEVVKADVPKDFALPPATDLAADLKIVIAACRDGMTVSLVTFDDKMKTGKDETKADAAEDGDEADGKDEADEEQA